MACLIEEIKVLGMSGRAINRDRADNRKRVLLEVAYKLFAKRVYALSLRLLASIRDAEEVTVDVFVKFNRELPRKWDESRVLDRLRELAIDEALGRLWGCTREGLREAAMKGVTQHASAETDHVKSNVVRGLANSSLDSATVDKLIAQLPDELRVVFVLHDMEGIHDRDIARHVRVRESDVRPLISRARLELRRHWHSQS